MLMSKHNKEFFLGLALFFVVEICWFFALFIVPAEKMQGEVYRIIYLHVASAVTTFLAAFILMIFSILSLRSQADRWMHLGRASAEVGLIFTVLTLITGSIWGRPTWGVYWTWDARLTTTLILGILYAGYLVLYSSFPHGQERSRASAILGILIFSCVPVIYKSVTWWRTLHQPPTLIREGGSTLSPEFLYLLIASIFSMVLLSLWFISVRAKNLALKHEIESLSV